MISLSGNLTLVVSKKLKFYRHEMHQPINRTAIYARVSTLDQDPEMQIRELRDYADRRKLLVVDEFIDRTSGAKEQRPELDRLWRAIRTRTIDSVLVWKFDRFARSTRQLINALEEFRHLGIDFVSITEQVDGEQ